MPEFRHRSLKLWPPPPSYPSPAPFLPVAVAAAFWIPAKSMRDDSGREIAGIPCFQASSECLVRPDMTGQVVFQGFQDKDTSKTKYFEQHDRNNQHVP